MTVTYTTAANVASLMGVTTWDGTSDPTLTEVEAIINRWEDIIDRRTGHGWRTKTSLLEYFDVDATTRDVDDQLSFKLANRSITTLTSGTDTLEVWTGGAWTDYLATKTEGRGGDYWVDTTNGVLYLIDYPDSGDAKVRVQYRYGESAVPGDITDACTKLVAADLLAQDDRSFIVPEGGQNINMNEKARQWKTEAEAILSDRVEFKPIIVR
jgi:hypothetical protein